MTALAACLEVAAVQPEFEVKVEAPTRVSRGETFTVVVSVRNTGSLPINHPKVEVTYYARELELLGPEACDWSGYYVPAGSEDWIKLCSIEFRVRDDAKAGSYSITLRISYWHMNEELSVVEEVRVRLAGPNLAVSDLRASSDRLERGETVWVSGVVRNYGAPSGEWATGVVVHLAFDGSEVSTADLGRIQPGGSLPFDLSLVIPSTAAAGPHVISAWADCREGVESGRAELEVSVVEPAAPPAETEAPIETEAPPPTAPPATNATSEVSEGGGALRTDVLAAIALALFLGLSAAVAGGWLRAPRSVRAAAAVAAAISLGVLVSSFVLPALPNPARDLYLRARDLQRSGQYGSAIAGYEEVLERYPESRYTYEAAEAIPACYQEWAAHLIAIGEYGEGVQRYCTLVEEYGESPQASPERADMLGDVPAEILLEWASKMESEGSYECALRLCDAILRYHSGSPQAPEAERIRVRIEISLIRGESHGELPPPVESSPTQLGGRVKVRIRNDTPYRLTVLLEGPTTLSLTIEASPGSSEYFVVPPRACPAGVMERTIFVEPGTYEVAVRVNDPNVSPYYGTWTLEPDTEYVSCFYILTTFG